MEQTEQTKQTEQRERISQMEQRLERAARAVMEMSAALDKYEAAKADFEAAQADLEALDAYYGSEEWKQDYADDEAGRLPGDLKRGVLSEDGIWNLLSDARDLKQRITLL